MGVKQDAQASAKESDQGKRNMLNQQLVLYLTKSSSNYSCLSDGLQFHGTPDAFELELVLRNTDDGPNGMPSWAEELLYA